MSDAAERPDTDWSAERVMVPPQVVLHAALWRIEHAEGHVFEACDLVRIAWPALHPYRDVIESKLSEVIASGGLNRADASTLSTLLNFVRRENATRLTAVKP